MAGEDDGPVIGISVGRVRGGDSRVLDAIAHEYAAAVVRAGGIPVLVPVVEGPPAAAVVRLIDGLVLSGGGDVAPHLYRAEAAPETAGVDPARDRSELALFDAALGRGVPVLGICRGMQLMNVALGGTLHQHLPSIGQGAHLYPERRDETVHEVLVVADTLLAELTGAATLAVNSVHHQGIDRTGDGLAVAGRSRDGLVEAVEDRRRRLLGVQWHPELIADEASGRAPFSFIVAASRRTRAGAGAS